LLHRKTVFGKKLLRKLRKGKSNRYQEYNKFKFRTVHYNMQIELPGGKEKETWRIKWI